MEGGSGQQLGQFQDGLARQEDREAMTWGCGHVTDESGHPLNVKCVECYIDWYRSSNG